MNITSEYHIGCGVPLVSHLGEFTPYTWQTSPSWEHRTFSAGWEKRYRFFKNNIYNKIAKLFFPYVLTNFMAL